MKNRVELARSAPYSFRTASPFPCGLAATLFASLCFIALRAASATHPGGGSENRVKLPRPLPHSFAPSPFPCGRQRTNVLKGLTEKRNSRASTYVPAFQPIMPMALIRSFARTLPYGIHPDTRLDERDGADARFPRHVLVGMVHVLTHELHVTSRSDF